MLSEICKTEKDKPYRFHLYMEPKKQNKLTKINRNRVIDIEDKHRDCQRGEGEGRRKIGERD